MRKEIYPLNHVLKLIRSGGNKKVDDDVVNLSSKRIKTFLKGTSCICCGIEGAFFAKEGYIAQPGYWHLSLYAYNKQGHEVLMTSDHKHPKSKGGSDKVKNRQPMCVKCNNHKGNRILSNEDLRVELGIESINNIKKRIKKLELALEKKMGVKKLKVKKLPEPPKEYYVYILLTAAGNYYTGISKNPARRLHEHNNTKKGAKALRGQRPVTLAFSMQLPLTKSQALKFEHKLKKLSHEEKETYIAGDLPIEIE